MLETIDKENIIKNKITFCQVKISNNIATQDIEDYQEPFPDNALLFLK